VQTRLGHLQVERGKVDQHIARHDGDLVRVGARARARARVRVRVRVRVGRRVRVRVRVSEA